jgi:hypothetical protein
MLSAENLPDSFQQSSTGDPVGPISRVSATEVPVAVARPELTLPSHSLPTFAQPQQHPASSWLSLVRGEAIRRGGKMDCPIAPLLAIRHR